MAKANDTYNAKSGLHDDLVLAASLALWSARDAENWFDGGEKFRATDLTDFFAGNLLSSLNSLNP